MKKIILFLLIFSFIFPFQALGSGIYKINGVEEFMTQEQKEQLELITRGFDLRCKDVKETDYPTIFIPGILASWYSEYGFEENKVKRWIPDPITHVYDPLFYTFRQNGYTLEDVFYEDEFNVKIEGNPKGALYLFGYDWKKDNMVTATLLTQLIGKILDEYEKQNGCDIEKVNIIAHSMGGLVARSMLEDMCVEYEKNGQKFNILNYYEYDEKGNIESLNGEIKKLDIKPCTNPIDSYKPIKVNKLITIATPHRGSPKAFPLWEKGDFGYTDDVGFEIGMKLQVGNIMDNGIYQKIHGYSDKVPNGIVGIGQLLPDIGNINAYNDNLLYLERDGKKMDRKNHPQNSFLEQLNTSRNIEKIWDKVDLYTQYYSVLTGINFNGGKNNIIGYTVPSIYLVGSNVFRDTTENFIGKDIYEKYSLNTSTEIYNIGKIIQKEDGAGGDGTVPTKNLKLVPNDSKTGKEIIHAKFRSEEIKCYYSAGLGKDNDWSVEDDINGINWIDKIFDDSKYILRESQLSWGIGDIAHLEMCSHTNMPITTSIKVFENISGKQITTGANSWLQTTSERQKILEHLGYATYLIDAHNDMIGITNKSLVDYFFKQTNYKKSEINNSPISLSLGTKITSVFRYDILSPINILITDSEGRRIGIDPDTGRIINEIPGAWTSGDTEGSNEPEFFIIPQTGTGKAEHTIETFATGEGEYHIEARKIDLGDESQDSGITELLTIAGNVEEGFGEEYKITSTQQSDYSYTQTSNYPPIITTGKDTYTTLEESIVLRYSIKGKSQGVEFIKYTLKDAEGKSIQEVTQDITGKLDITLPQVGDFTLDLELLNLEKKQIENTKTTLKLTRTTDWREEDQAYQEKLESAKTGEDYETLIQEYGERRKKGVVIDLWSWFGD